MNPMAGKTIWIVGASEGIGAALAHALAHAGATLLLSARRADALAAVLASLTPGDHRAFPLDVTDAESVAVAWQAITSANGVPDMLVYNAGAYDPMDAQHFDLARIEKVLDVNLHGALRVLSHVLPAFLARGRGHIALVGSVAGYRGLPAAMGYGASKAAIIHLAENLKADLVGTGVEVQIVNPGFVRTRLTEKNDFTMPCIISPEQAAQAMVRGLQSDAFEIHFPKRFSWLLKCMAALPAPLYFWLLRQVRW